jgi:hypothetical protein
MADDRNQVKQHHQVENPNNPRNTDAVKTCNYVMIRLQDIFSLTICGPTPL